MVKAYHGSPHDFEAFDISKVGTGEGAQAYGHGLYFAENPKVAGQYRAALSDLSLSINGKRITTTPGSVADGALAWVQDAAAGHHDDPIGQAITDLKDMIATHEGGPSVARPRYGPMIRQLEGWQSAGAKLTPGGALYHVHINAEPHEFLQWDKPLSEQSPQVQAALQRVGIDVSPASRVPSTKEAQRLFGSERVARLAADDIGTREILRQGFARARDGDEAAFAEWFRRHGKLISPGRRLDPLGSEIYQDMQISGSGGRGGSVEASAALNRAGIRGIRYLDQGSRGTGVGTHNYVLFDPSLAQIVEKGASRPGILPYLTAAAGAGLTGAALTGHR